MRRRYAGFTLLELLVVIAILGILMALLVPVLLYARKKARIAETHALLDRVAKGLEQYRVSWGCYPIRPGGSGVIIDVGTGTFDPGYYPSPCAPMGSAVSGVEDNSKLIKALRDSGNLDVKPSEVVNGRLVDSFDSPVIVRFLIVAPTAANQEKLTERAIVWSYGPDRINHVKASPAYSNGGMPAYDDAEIKAVESFSEKDGDDIVQW
jgi:prepilin-type N-terminal cleavage/methylation domain-containing protein